MTDEQRIKVNVIIDKLYDATKAGKCDWKKLTASVDSYIITFNVGGQIRIHGGEKKMTLEIYNNNGVKIGSLDYRYILKNTTAIKLFHHVKTYHDEWTAKILDKILEDLNKLTKETSTCSKCGVKTHFVMTIDQWAIIDGEEYCMKCQKEHKVGWYEPKYLNEITGKPPRKWNLKFWKK